MSVDNSKIIKDNLSNLTLGMGLNVNILTALAMVESQGEFIRSNTKLHILYERHWFYRLLIKDDLRNNARKYELDFKHKFQKMGRLDIVRNLIKIPQYISKRHMRHLKSKDKVDIKTMINYYCYSRATEQTLNLTNDRSILNYISGEYGKFSEQWDKLERASNINEELAYQSISMGAFQIMGFHHKVCGYPTATDMFKKFNRDPMGEQLNAFINFIKANDRLMGALIDLDFKQIAYYYNGSGYRRNDYDKKLEQAYIDVKNA